jgi:3'(2'), 5'-bisphosphate nucleotidase
MTSMSGDLDLSVGADSRLIDDITTLLSRAAAAILEFDFSAVARKLKSDLSPVTAADEAAQSIVLEGLSTLLPGIPVISEEMNVLDTRLRANTMFILLDPLDGTREFLAGRNEFTVNLGLVSSGVPILGCIAAPALGIVWRGMVGRGAERLQLPAGANALNFKGREPIRTRRLLAEQPIVAVSRSRLDSRTERLVASILHAERIVCGSSLKFCMIAEGRADFYPRLGPTHEWDIAAGHAIVAAAGGTVVMPNGAPMTYGRLTGHFRVDGFMAIGDVRAVQMLAREIS